MWLIVRPLKRPFIGVLETHPFQSVPVPRRTQSMDENLPKLVFRTISSSNRYNRSYWKFRSVVSDKKQFAFSWNVSADWTGIVCKTYCEILLSRLIYLLIESTVRNFIFLDSVYWKEILIQSLRTNVNATFHLQFFFYIYIIKFCFFSFFFLNIVAIKRNCNDSVDILSTSSVVHRLRNYWKLVDSTNYVFWNRKSVVHHTVHLWEIQLVYLVRVKHYYVKQN